MQGVPGNLQRGHGQVARCERVSCKLAEAFSGQLARFRGATGDPVRASNARSRADRARELPRKSAQFHTVYRFQRLCDPFLVFRVLVGFCEGWFFCIVEFLL